MQEKQQATLLPAARCRLRRRRLVCRCLASTATDLAMTVILSHEHARLCSPLPFFLQCCISLKIDLEDDPTRKRLFPANDLSRVSPPDTAPGAQAGQNEPAAPFASQSVSAGADGLSSGQAIRGSAGPSGGLGLPAPLAWLGGRIYLLGAQLIYWDTVLLVWLRSLLLARETWMILFGLMVLLSAHGIGQPNATALPGPGPATPSGATPSTGATATAAPSVWCLIRRRLSQLDEVLSSLLAAARADKGHTSGKGSKAVKLHPLTFCSLLESSLTW